MLWEIQANYVIIVIIVETITHQFGIGFVISTYPLIPQSYSLVTLDKFYKSGCSFLLYCLL